MKTALHIVKKAQNGLRWIFGDFVITGLFAAMFLALIVISTSLSHTDRVNLQKDTAVTTGAVVYKYFRVGITGGLTNYYFKVEYTDTSRHKHIARIQAGQDFYDQHGPLDHVTVFYDPANPGKAILHNNPVNRWMWVPSLAVVFAGFGLFEIVRWAYIKRQKQGRVDPGPGKPRNKKLL